MNPAMLKTMKVKKKRAIDPNAPPRPNLLSHEKVLKDTKVTMSQMADRINMLERRLAEAEAKMRRQTEYMQQLHNVVTSRKN